LPSLSPFVSGQTNVSGDDTVIQSDASGAIACEAMYPGLQMHLARRREPGRRLPFGFAKLLNAIQGVEVALSTFWVKRSAV
jgi:hypothetical protein